MKFISLPIEFEGKVYRLDPFLGLVLEWQKQKAKRAIKLTDKVTTALSHCNNPYDLIKSEPFSAQSKSLFQQKLLRGYIEFLIRMVRLNFYLGRRQSVFIVPCFKDAARSIIFFRSIKKGEIQNDLCLVRSLFAAYSSEKFKESGVLFIGISLPSKSMHAWIIEDGRQPDPCDNIWINFQPIAVIC